MSNSIKPSSFAKQVGYYLVALGFYGSKNPLLFFLILIREISKSNGQLCYSAPQHCYTLLVHPVVSPPVILFF